MRLTRISPGHYTYLGHHSGKTYTINRNDRLNCWEADRDEWGVSETIYADTLAGIRAAIHAVERQDMFWDGLDRPASVGRLA